MITLQFFYMLKLKWFSEFIIYNSITDNLVSVPNMRGIDILHTSQTGMSVVRFSENHFSLTISQNFSLYFLYNMQIRATINPFSFLQIAL